MTSFLKPVVEEVLLHENPLQLDPAWDGGCPCATIEGAGFRIAVHCWRVGGGCCEYSGVHVTGDLPEKLRLRMARHVAVCSGWWGHTDWKFSLEEYLR